jgi:two-component system sensor histidine kinase DegS
VKVAISKQILGVLRFKTRGETLNSPHFWAIIVFTLFLVFIYQAWPWRVWKFSDGVWQWFFWLSPLYKLAIVEATNHIVGIIFFIPIIYSGLFFSWRGTMVTSLLSLGGVLPIIVGMWNTSVLVSNIALLLVPFLSISIIVFEIDWRRKERKIFNERERERIMYISRILEAQENERRSIAQELHDETIQTLLAMASRAEVLLSSDCANIHEMRANTKFTRKTTLETVENLRRISLSLRPSILDNLGLISALRWLVDNMSNETDIDVRFIISGTQRKISNQAEAAIFRVAQEALHNIKHHSKAGIAVITLEFTAECIKLTIEDNGQGFSPPPEIDKYATKGKLGLIGMQHRIKLLNGTFEIRSKPGKGTLLLINVKC